MKCGKQTTTLKSNKMNYLDFVVTIVRENIKLSKDQMQFAYVVCFQGMNMNPVESAELVLGLDELKVL